MIFEENLDLFSFEKRNVICKDKNQERQFIICLKYIKSHYKHLLKVGVLENDFNFQGNGSL